MLTRIRKRDIIGLQINKQVSPSGMAAASQAVPGEFDSRHLLQNKSRTHKASYFYFSVDNVGESNSEGEFCVKKTVDNRF